MNFYINRVEMIMKKTLQVYLGLILAAQLTGCALVAAGAGAGAGYYVAQDERAPNQIISDAGITASINAKYIKDRQVSALDINVDTRDAVVTLYGSVANRAIEDRAIALAAEAVGVKKVISKITVVGPAK